MNLRRIVSSVAAAVWQIRQVPDALAATKPAQPWRRPRTVDPSGARLRVVSASTRAPWCRFCFGPCLHCEHVDSAWEPDWARVEPDGGAA